MENLNKNKQLENIRNEFSAFHIMRYSELPDIDLYMDQVTAYLNKHLEMFSKNEESIITSSMINNYVKYDIMPAPSVKKYTRRHLAYIIAVYFLKQILKMNEIRGLIKYHIDNSSELKAYELFCDELERALKTCAQVPALTFDNVDDIGTTSIKVAVSAIASKIYAQKIIELMGVDATSERKPEKKSDKAEKKKKAKQDEAAQKNGTKKKNTKTDSTKNSQTSGD